MAEVFAGFVCGYAVALLFTPLVALMVIDARSRMPYLAKAIAPNISAVALTVPISLFAFLIWTAIGMVLGLLYRGAEQNIPQGGLGSPNLLYTALVVSFGASARRAQSGRAPTMLDCTLGRTLDPWPASSLTCTSTR